MLALSTYSANLGTPVDAYINGSLPTASEVKLRFTGVYERVDGVTEPVDFLSKTSAIDAATVRWTGLGPFSNPFTKANDAQLGAFVGTVSARIVTQDGSILDDPSRGLPTRFEVGPSILIDEFQPLTATCGQPVTRAFGGLKYRMHVRAIGFEPVAYTYTLNVPKVLDAPDDTDPSLVHPSFELGADGQPARQTSQLTHDSHAPDDMLEGSDSLYVPNVPEDVEAYNLSLTVEAYDAAKQAYRSTLVMRVQRPLEFYYDGRYSVVQLYAPVPVSSCLPGGANGRSATYTDTQTETRTRAYTVTLNYSWLNSISTSEGATVNNTWSTSDGLTYTKSVVDTSGWQDSSATGTSNSTGSSNSFGFSSGGSKDVKKDTAIETKDDNGHNTSLGVNGGVEGTAEVGFLGTGGKATGKVGATGGVGDTSSNGGSTKTDVAMSGSETHSSSSANGDSSGTSTSVVATDQVSGSTASTDSTQGTHVDGVMGGTAQSSGTGSGASEGGGEQNANGWTVSSSSSIGQGLSGLVVAGRYGVWYRQTARFQRQAFIIEYDKCGGAGVVGEATLDDYTWSVDLAQGDECPPFPATKLPAPQCISEPCDPY